MDKKQLKNLKNYVENDFPESLAAYNYYDVNTKCNCVIGSMLTLVGGEQDDPYFDNENDVDHFRNFAKSKDAHLKSLHKKFLKYFGMEQMDINELQGFNDEFEPDNFRCDILTENKLRAKAVKAWLQNYINEKESELT